MPSERAGRLPAGRVARAASRRGKGRAPPLDGGAARRAPTWRARPGGGAAGRRTGRRRRGGRPARAAARRARRWRRRARACSAREPAQQARRRRAVLAPPAEPPPLVEPVLRAEGDARPAASRAEISGAAVGSDVQKPSWVYTLPWWWMTSAAVMPGMRGDPFAGRRELRLRDRGARAKQTLCVSDLWCGRQERATTRAVDSCAGAPGDAREPSRSRARTTRVVGDRRALAKREGALLRGSREERDRSRLLGRCQPSPPASASRRREKRRQSTRQLRGPRARRRRPRC